MQVSPTVEIVSLVRELGVLLCEGCAKCVFNHFKRKKNQEQIALEYYDQVWLSVQGIANRHRQCVGNVCVGAVSRLVIFALFLVIFPDSRVLVNLQFVSVIL